MTLHEDAYCPVCPDPDTAFRIEDVGMKHRTSLDGEGLTFTISRPAWEDLMLVHLETMDDDAHRRHYLKCMLALEAEGMSPEDVARQDVQRVADWARRTLEGATGVARP